MPIFQVLKRLLVSNVVGEHDCICLVDVGANHFAEEGLAADVPDLEGDVRLLGQFKTFYKEVYSNGLLVAAAKLVFTEPRNEGSLSNGTIADDNYFVLKVFGLLFVFFI